MNHAIKHIKLRQNLLPKKLVVINYARILITSWLFNVGGVKLMPEIMSYKACTWQLQLAFGKSEKIPTIAPEEVIQYVEHTLSYFFIVSTCVNPLRL